MHPSRTLFEDPRPTPRDYQRYSVDALHAALQADGRALGEIATGLGKTLIAAMLSERYKRTMIMDPRISLCGQIAKGVEEWRLHDVEVEQADKYAAPSASVVVGSLQSLLTGDRGKRFAPDLVIVDEAHYGMGGPALDLLDHYRSKGAVVCGLTATPHGSAAMRYYGRCPVQYGVVPGIEHGWLVPISARRVVMTNIVTPEETTCGEFDREELKKILRAEAVIQEQAALVVANHRSRGAVYCHNRQHAIAMRDMIERHGVKCALVYSGMSPTDRAAEMKRYESGEASLICNISILTMGWDSAVEELHLLAPTRSLQRYLQIIGRALRPGRGVVDGQPTEYLRRLAISQGPKPHCRIIDYTDTTRFHRVCSAIDVVLPPAKAQKYREKLLAASEDHDVELASLEAEIREQERIERDRVMAEMAAEKERRAGIRVGVEYEAHDVNVYAKPTVETPKRREARMLWGPWKGKPIRIIPRQDLKQIIRSMRRSPGNEWLVRAIQRELKKGVSA